MSDFEDENNWEENDNNDYNMDENTDEEDATAGSSEIAGDLCDEPEEDAEEVKESCLKSFACVDYIMEPGVSNQLQRFFKNFGDPTDCVTMLSENYKGLAQMINILADFLITAGVGVDEVQEMVENHLKDIIIRNFDAKRADSIFSSEGETPAWLAQMIEYRNWRTLFYDLSTLYPDCLMLNFTIKLICDAGHHSEITSVSTACHQIEVFTSVLRSSASIFLTGSHRQRPSLTSGSGGGSSTDAGTSASCGQGDSLSNNCLMATHVESLAKFIEDFTNMACYGEHTYLYVQHLLHMMITGGNPNFVIMAGNSGTANLKYLSQCVEKEALKRKFDITPITLMLVGASRYPRLYGSLAAMLSRKALNPADITVLYKLYNQPDPPHIDLIRSPQFLELLIEMLFKPGVKMNAEHVIKYIYLLAYACCVVEQYNKKGQIKSINKDELRSTIQAIDRAHSLCAENKGCSELIADVGTLFQCIKFPPAAAGILYWVDLTISQSTYFTLNTDHSPLHLLLLDEIASNHQLLHEKAFTLLIRLFVTDFENMDVLMQITLKKSLLDRMIHLMSKGYVLPVISYVKKCIREQCTDISLIRYFATEVLDVVCPPYSEEFIQLFYPIIDNTDIITRGDPLIEEFLDYCKSTYNLGS